MADALRSVNDLVNGIRIHARVSVDVRSTSLPPLVFVHGLGASTRYMEPTMARLAREHSVAGLDLPGFGRSETPDHVLGLQELADTVAMWADARGIGPAIYIGNSHGCQVSVRLAATHPGRVLGLVLNAPTMDAHHRTMFGQIVRVLADIPNEPWRLAPIIVRDYLRAGPVRVLTTLRDALRDPVEESLKKLTMPVAVVAGARDPVVTTGWAEEVARMVGLSCDGAAGATFTIVHSAAHALPFEDPAAFAPFITSLAERSVQRLPSAPA